MIKNKLTSSFFLLSKAAVLVGALGWNYSFAQEKSLSTFSNNSFASKAYQCLDALDQADRHPLYHNIFFDYYSYYILRDYPGHPGQKITMEELLNKVTSTLNEINKNLEEPIENTEFFVQELTNLSKEIKNKVSESSQKSSILSDLNILIQWKNELEEGHPWKINDHLTLEDDANTLSPIYQFKVAPADYFIPVDNCSPRRTDDENSPIRPIGLFFLEPSNDLSLFYVSSSNIFKIQLEKDINKVSDKIYKVVYGMDSTDRKKVCPKLMMGDIEYRQHTMYLQIKKKNNKFVMVQHSLESLDPVIARNLPIITLSTKYALTQVSEKNKNMVKERLSLLLNNFPTYLDKQFELIHSIADNSEKEKFHFPSFLWQKIENPEYMLEGMIPGYKNRFQDAKETCSIALGISSK